jgi:hypothetical protein|tara:strand:- start:109 stop:636 length:528 start_codon:yes stop_codon:yes gene_type:complete
MIILIITIIITFFYYIYSNERKNNPDSINNNKSYPHKNDNISTLLDRIEWSSLYPTRMNVISRYLLWGLWVVSILNTIFKNDSITLFKFLKMWIFSTIILLFLHNYYYWHADKFRYIGTIDSVNMLRKKLKKRKGNLEKLSNISKIDGGRYPWVWTHEDYIMKTELNNFFSDNLD